MFSVVIVDDQLTSLKILRQLITKLPVEKRVESFTEPTSALEWVKQNACDLAIIDLRMPVMNGVDFLRWFRKLPNCDDVPVIVVTIAEDTQSRYSALQAGATDFLTKPLDHIEFQARCENLLTLRKQQRIIKDRAQWLEHQVANAVKDIEAREKDTLLHLAKAGAYRDPYTGEHVKRMAQYCRVISKSLGLNDSVCHTLEYAAPLHDIGKIGIPDDILLKPGVLTAVERQLMCSHAEMGYSILRNSPSKYLQMGATVALYHHEHYDGQGYPNGLRGIAIPVEARIVAIADVFDALTSKRPYKSAWPLEQALEHIKQRSGQQFDPDCVEAFLGALDTILDIYNHYQVGLHGQAGNRC